MEHFCSTLQKKWNIFVLLFRKNGTTLFHFSQTSWTKLFNFSVLSKKSTGFMMFLGEGGSGTFLFYFPEKVEHVCSTFPKKWNNVGQLFVKKVEQNFVFSFLSKMANTSCFCSFAISSRFFPGFSNSIN